MCGVEFLTFDILLHTKAVPIQILIDFVHQYPMEILLKPYFKFVLIETIHLLNCRSTFLIETPVFNGFLKIISAQNHIHITFCSALVCNKILKARNSPPTHTNF